MTWIAFHQILEFAEFIGSEVTAWSGVFANVVSTVSTLRLGEAHRSDENSSFENTSTSHRLRLLSTPTSCTVTYWPISGRAQVKDFVVPSSTVPGYQAHSGLRCRSVLLLPTRISRSWSGWWPQQPRVVMRTTRTASGVSRSTRHQGDTSFCVSEHSCPSGFWFPGLPSLANPAGPERVAEDWFTGPVLPDTPKPQKFVRLYPWLLADTQPTPCKVCHCGRGAVRWSRGNCYSTATWYGLQTSEAPICNRPIPPPDSTAPATRTRLIWYTVLPSAGGTGFYVQRAAKLDRCNLWLDVTAVENTAENAPAKNGIFQAVRSRRAARDI
uniref:Uncharacterized protein n=1 Tax=Anopheles atroparvus TaxID=41427 RepID=A0A182JBA3_ANOAO